MVGIEETLLSPYCDIFKRCVDTICSRVQNLAEVASSRLKSLRTHCEMNILIVVLLFSTPVRSHFTVLQALSSM